MSETETDAAPPSETTPPDTSAHGDPESEEYLARAARMVRLHNLMILVVLGCGLVCLALLRTLHSQLYHPEWQPLLITLRIALPILALVLTGVVTHRAITRLANTLGDRVARLADTWPAYRRCKLLSMFSLTVAGLFANACLLVGNRVSDLLLAVGALLLLTLTRPGPRALPHFTALIEAHRHEEAGEDG